MAGVANLDGALTEPLADGVSKQLAHFGFRMGTSRTLIGQLEPDAIAHAMFA